MLHEILLALSGHSSTLLEPDVSSKEDGRDPRLALSVSEQHLLASIGTLSRLHRRLRQHLDRILKHHKSMICRATANSLRQVHLSRFNDKVLQVEASILHKDASTVGAYDIVPLAYIADQFNDWQRRMAWYWSLAIFMLPVNHEDDGAAACSGAALIDRLRADAQTGFPDIEGAAIELSKVAELAWVKQLASWLFYGKINASGQDDFFVQNEKDELGQVAFRRRRELLPRFVSHTTASAILFIGKSLHQLQDSTLATARETSSKVDFLSITHSAVLSELTFPLVSAQLTQSITTIRESLSRNILQDLLSVRTTRAALHALRRFFLLTDLDFATYLIKGAERRVEARWQNMDRLAQQDPLKALQGLSIKEAETTQVLRLTWKQMAAQLEAEDDVLDFSKKHVTLAPSRRAPSRPATADSTAADRFTLSSVTFNDLLFASSASLVLDIKPPLDLFLSAIDIVVYTHINAYLLSIRRAQLRLEDLWRRPATKRAGSHSQVMILRRVWATCSATLLLLTEVTAYLTTDVINPSCDHFEAWTNESPQEDHGALKDPETLAAGHGAFIDSLAYGLLLTDTGYTKDLRSLLGVIDQMTSVFVRYLDAEDNEAASIVNERLQQELVRACHKAELDRRSVINRLREIHLLRVGSDRYFDVSRRDTGGFEPWKAGGIDHLLMKLEYGQTHNDTNDE